MFDHVKLIVRVTDRPQISALMYTVCLSLLPSRHLAHLSRMNSPHSLAFFVPFSVSHIKSIFFPSVCLSHSLSLYLSSFLSLSTLIRALFLALSLALSLSIKVLSDPHAECKASTNHAAAHTATQCKHTRNQDFRDIHIDHKESASHTASHTALHIATHTATRASQHTRTQNLRDVHVDHKESASHV